MRLRFTIGVFLFAFSYLTLTSPLAQADEIRRDTPSGFPVPRFVSLQNNETNCRIGPSFEHPVRFVFQRAGAPVLVVAESVDFWRKIRDLAGDECWVHKSTLVAQNHVMTVSEVELRARPHQNASARGRLGVGVLVRIEKRKNGWLMVSADSLKGWVSANEVWGGEIAPLLTTARN